MAFIALIAILIATLNVNIGANVVSPSNDFSNLYPRLISFRTGGLITGFLGLAMCPWKLLATPDAYIFGWLVGYSGLLGPVAGIMVCDYFLIRNTELDINSLYHREGAYHYTKGINPRAIVALVLGVGLALIGLFVPRRCIFSMTTHGSSASSSPASSMSRSCTSSRRFPSPRWRRASPPETAKAAQPDWASRLHASV